MKLNKITLSICFALSGCEYIDSHQLGDKVEVGNDYIQVRDVYSSLEECQKDWYNLCEQPTETQIQDEIAKDENNLEKEAKEIEEPTSGATGSTGSTGSTTSTSHTTFIPWFWSPMYSATERSYHGFAPSSNHSTHKFNDRVGVVKNSTMQQLYNKGLLSKATYTPKMKSNFHTVNTAKSSGGRSVARGGFGGRGASGG